MPEDSPDNTEIPTGMRLGLRRITNLLKVLDFPERSIPAVHIAGTNGKGSVSAFLDAILSQSGLRVGRFNSPHLISIHDSILLEGKPIVATTYDKTRKLVEEADKQHNIEASAFELLTATAFLAFQRHQPKLDAAIVEVGLGGAEDATNAIAEPLLSILTNVDLDHQKILGNTVEKIAQAKCGIFKQGRPCLVGPQTHPEVFKVAETTAQRQSCNLTRVISSENSSNNQPPTMKLASGDILPIEINMKGAHQVENAATAIRAADVLRTCYPESFGQITLESIKAGLLSAYWPGRLHTVKLRVDGQDLEILVDGAHNPSSARLLGQYLTTLDPQKRITLILALSAPRQPGEILSAIVEPLKKTNVRVIGTQFSTPIDGMPWVSNIDLADIPRVCHQMGLESVASPNLLAAIRYVIGRKAALNSTIVVAGSLYLASDVYRMAEKEIGFSDSRHPRSLESNVGTC